MKLELTILKNLIFNEEFSRKVLPFIKSEYFTDAPQKILFGQIREFILEYNTLPTYESLSVTLRDAPIRENDLKSCLDVLEHVNASKNDESNQEWLVDQTEKFCQEKAVYNAVLESISILDNKSQEKTKGAIPQLLSDALAVSFDSNVGHDYLESSSDRYDFYHKVEARIPFDLSWFNKITKNGLPRKTLNIALAGTGVGKSLFMCHVAAGCLSQGYNVLYITLELAEERVAERIDANLLNVSLNDMVSMPKDIYMKRLAKIKEKTTGKLIIKEYPTAGASTIHFRTLLNELNLKRSFKPDIIFIDYLNICASARIKVGSNVNSYSYIKSIAEEIRGLAVEYNVPIVSATQTTRSGFGSSDPGLEDTSESFGLPATADFMFALISNEQLESLNQIMVKQLKNRYNDPTTNKRFVIGVDRAKMKLYDIEQSAQDNITDSGQVEEPQNKFQKFGQKKSFSGLKV